MFYVLSRNSILIPPTELSLRQFYFHVFAVSLLFFTDVLCLLLICTYLYNCSLRFNVFSHAFEEKVVHPLDLWMMTDDDG